MIHLIKVFDTSFEWYSYIFWISLTVNGILRLISLIAFVLT